MSRTDPEPGPARTRVRAPLAVALALLGLVSAVPLASAHHHVTVPLPSAEGQQQPCHSAEGGDWHRCRHGPVDTNELYWNCHDQGNDPDDGDTVDRLDGVGCPIRFYPGVFW